MTEHENPPKGALEKRDTASEAASSGTSSTPCGTSSGTPSGTSHHRQPGRTRRRYGAEEIELGLRAVALANGNTTKASRELAKQGKKIPARTLWGWKREDHIERYRQIQTEVVPEIHARIAEQSDALALQAGELEADLIKRLQKVAPDVPAKDLSRAVRDVATSRKVSVEKSLSLRGGDQPKEPTIEDFNEALKGLQDLGLIEKTAKHVTIEEIEISGRDVQDEEQDEDWSVRT
jgi:hypothetical protein